jgi:rhodanese-related sulfurtransferase
MANAVPIEIDPLTVQQLFDSEEEFLLLDCREPTECSIVRIESATPIPMGEIPARLAELEEHRDRRIVVHCHHGGRSLQVTEWLRAQGFSSVQNMSGGIDAWALEVDKTLPRY